MKCAVGSFVSQTHVQGEKNESVAGSSLSSLPNKFHLPKTYAFKNQKFGSKGKKQSCRVALFDKYNWLHYDATADSARRQNKDGPGRPTFSADFFLGALYVCHARTLLT